MTMDKDIKRFPLFQLTPQGSLIPIQWISSIGDYNHSVYHLHHYIQKQYYDKNEKWYKERGIKQKLILMPIKVHEQVHSQAIRTLSDEEFLKRYRISKWDLIFNRKYSKY